MRRILFFIIAFVMTNVAYAYTNYNQNFNTFNSKLNMNRPKVNIASYEARPRYNPNHCYHCRHHDHVPYYSRNNINSLERYVFDKTYRRQSDLERLERLENLAFGAIQNGDINDRFRRVETAILSRPKSNIKRSVLGNIANYFVGTATGITPSVFSDNGSNYNMLGGFSDFYPYPNYSNHTMEQYSNGMFGGRGWGFSGNDFGTGSSIRILD